MQSTDSIFIRFECNQPPVLRKIEFVDVPFEFGSQYPAFVRCKVDINQALEFRILIAGEVNTFAVFAKASIAICDCFRSRLWSQQFFLAGSNIDQPHITLGSRYSVDGQ